MKPLPLLLLLLLFTLLPTRAVRKPEANPINVAVMLTEQPDSASIASTLDYYGYRPASDDSSLKTQDLRLKTYTHPNGSAISYRFTIADNGRPYPTVEVKAKATQSETEEILKNLNFRKKGSAYERRSIDHLTRCTNGPAGAVIFQNTPKPKKD